MDNVHRLIRFALVILSLGLLALGPAGMASAASDKVTVVNLRGPLANAWFSSTDPSGCVQTDTFVRVQRSTYHQMPDPKTTTGNLAVSIFEYNLCTGASLLNVVGETEALPQTDLFISNQLDVASVHTTLVASNLDTGDPVTLDVNVAWVGTSDIHRDHSNTNDRYSRNCHVLNRWKGSGRDAAASGTVSVGSTNYAPTPSYLGEIGVVISGFEVIGCA
jgi:hypothetical protein